ncbi:acetyl-CoA carboxylase biotin carboxyl carrier protein [Paenibacillus urinalis]|uniref:Biotin carboxyl carrier protein of acetyl-CoA carboxylase n=1 Tax=Paenibacillus urinalis TaxID=521520 RepID=A0ABY7X5B7_9BACL|nr:MULTISPECIES: acetyl-CoA carboxylase biotin carboxyl carrier protein [Paenibacillus]WDH97377.1 acetyl-CoA carboxylase biotin carboxyl carrier protein [Paenibacillus urinalis]WDI01041.1 acetyl-CoA carboxylase biotin carboxyl carrier protein [Paenibacillus urinalis]GAK39908.1 acetyl-CoA carboxylase, biotin carboxyl carrier protein [Paenibacillus sp. TCA20]
MFKLNEIKELIKVIDESSVQELEIENEGSRLTIRKPGKTEIVQAAAAVSAYPVTSQVQPVPQAIETPAAAPVQEQATANSNLHKIVSPMVGTFYSAPSPEAGVFVNVGSKVTEKSTVCIVEAMKLMNEIEADVKGEIVEILVQNGQLVEYGQPLFLVKPE